MFCTRQFSLKICLKLCQKRFVADFLICFNWRIPIIGISDLTFHMLILQTDFSLFCLIWYQNLSFFFSFLFFANKPINIFPINIYSSIAVFHHTPHKSTDQSKTIVIYSAIPTFPYCCCCQQQGFSPKMIRENIKYIQRGLIYSCLP